MDQVMAAAVLTRHGGADALEVRADWPVPAAGSGEALVRVTAAAVNNTDIWTREGAYGLPGQPDAKAGWRGPIDFPRVQGGDIAGLVVAVGADVPAELVGRRVLVDPAIYRDDGPNAPPVGLLGSEADGGFATYVAVPAAQAHDVTDSPLSDEELACLPVAYGTAMGMLERAEVRAGETVLVTGASGGVGLALVQLAAARGAEVVAVTGAVKAGAVKEAGATQVVSDRSWQDPDRPMRPDRPESWTYRPAATSCRTQHMAVDLVIDIDNTPGALAQVAAAISDAGVNIAAATCIGPGERAELHILVPHAGAAKHSLAISHLAVTREREVVVVDVEDRPGVLADLTRKIARAGVDLDLVYVATRNRVVFGAADLDALKAALDAAS